MRRRIALAGLGVAARTIHLPAYQKLNRLELVGGYDPALPSSADGLWPFPLFASLPALLAETAPDILAVAAPTAFHFELSRAGLLAGCHVFCEKPFMTDLSQADEIIALADEVGRWVVVNNEFRFMRIHQAAQQKIGAADFGELRFLDAQQTFIVSEQTEAGWRGADPQRTCKEFGIHVLDLCRYFFAQEPTAIYARMPRGESPDPADYLNLIQLEFPGDRVAAITLDRWSRGRHRYLDLRLDGSESTVETRIGGLLACSAGVRGGSRKPFLDLDVAFGGSAFQYRGERRKKLASDPLDLFANATSLLLRAFLDALDNGTTPPCHAADNRRSLALMLAAYQSQRQRRMIELAS